ncbi:alkaline phosphatase family protein [Patulibacter sp. NPDC049589]|uniref:phospholipase C n=1 Tax=Patulibacter sp. NPDC049589 TaxID=3154731 RepID=UPI0034173051
MRKSKTFLAGGGLAAAAAVVIGISGAHAVDSVAPSAAPTTTPIKHVVVLYDENESFDHYFATYPNAAKPDGDAAAGEPAFHPKPGTPSVNGLSGPLLTNNPNAANPARLARGQAVTCSQNHGYGPEQKAFDGGLMDKFVENTQGGGCTAGEKGQNIVMDYYDGNTVTGLWNLAQNYALSDNSFSTNFGPSTVGAINLISGETGGVTTGGSIAGSTENNAIIGDPGPSTTQDDCTYAGSTVTLGGKNVGDLLNAKGLSWGFFQGGFRPDTPAAGASPALCTKTHNNVAGVNKLDYIPHHEPFEYYASTANKHHTPPASTSEIGLDGGANHQYDLTDFDAALQNGTLPSVSILKAAGFEDGHPQYSDPLDEQRFIARTLNALENSPEWSSTAVVIAYDDSDGWYDHVASPNVNPSASTSDALSGTGKCGTVKDVGAENARCGYGPRQPLLVISPYAKQNYVDHALTDQSSILRFIEDNWSLGRIGGGSMDAKAGSIQGMFDFTSGAKAPKVFLDPDTGVVTKTVADPTGTSTTPTTTVTTPGATVTTPGATVTTPGATVTTPGKTITTPGKTTKAPKVTASCSAKRSGKRITVSCTTKGATNATKANVRIRLYRGSKLLGTKTAALKNKKAALTLTSKKAWPKATYTLRTTVTQIGGVTSSTKKLALR